MAKIILNGSSGRIECLYNRAARNAPIVVLLHPHPQFRGHANNPMMNQLSDCFTQHNFAVLRLNFRGSGKTEGSRDEREGDILDTTTALNWLESQHADSQQTWICGFSFGAWVGMQLLMRRPGIFRFISIAPPIGPFNFDFLAPCPASGVIISAKADQYVNGKSLKELNRKLRNNQSIDVKHHIIKDANHFMAGKEDEVIQRVHNYVAREKKKVPTER